MRLLPITLALCLAWAAPAADPPKADWPPDQAAVLRQINDRLAAIESRLTTLEATSGIEARLRALEQRTEPVAYTAGSTTGMPPAPQPNQAHLDEWAAAARAAYQRGLDDARGRQVVTTTAPYPQFQPPPQSPQGVATYPPFGLSTLAPSAGTSPPPAPAPGSYAVVYRTAPMYTSAPATERRGGTSRGGLLGLGILPRLLGGYCGGGTDPTPEFRTLGATQSNGT
jgi:hypothetical protein